MLRFFPCVRIYWEFVRQLRTDPRTSPGFVQQAEITPDQQIEYMQRHWQKHWVALKDGEPVGYVGVIDGDIRVCVHPDYQRQGIGAFLIRELVKIRPEAVARVKVENTASRKLFESCGFKMTTVVYQHGG